MTYQKKEKRIVSISDAEDAKPTKSQTLVRGLDVIEAVASGHHTLAEIARATGMTYSTTHRFTTVLADRGYLRAVRGREFELGPKLIELGFQAHNRTDIVAIAHVFLHEFAQKDGDTVHLGRREGDEVVYLDKIQGNRPVEINSRIGGRRPLSRTGIGMALLIDSPEQEMRAVFASNQDRPPSIAQEDAFVDRMSDYVHGGYALDIGDDSPSIRCVAAPVRGPSGEIVAAISLSSAADYMSERRMQDLIPQVKAVARKVSAALGHRQD